MEKKRKRVPEPIWQLFGRKARTLGETIMRLIPTHCHCNPLRTIKPKLCLYCCFHQGSEQNPSSYLFRPNDPPEYTDLLNRTFVFLPDNAPPLPPDSLSGTHWTLVQVLQKTVQMIEVKHPKSANLLACGYDKFKDSIPKAKRLNSSAWNLVLQRVGEMMMIYLLLNTTIFVHIPIPGGGEYYEQVTGPSACALIPPYRRTNSVQQGLKKKNKRRREDEHNSSPTNV